MTPNLGGFQTGRFPTFSGKVRIVSQTLSGLFLAGAVRPGMRKRINQKNPRTNWEDSEKIGKVPKRTKKDKLGRTSPDRETPRLKPPRLAALVNDNRSGLPNAHAL